MALDMNGMLPGADGAGRKRRSSGGKFLLLIVLIAICGGGYAVYNRYGENIKVKASELFEKLNSKFSDITSEGDSSDSAIDKVAADSGVASTDVKSVVLPPQQIEDDSKKSEDNSNVSSEIKKDEPKKTVEPKPVKEGLAAEWEKVKELQREGDVQKLKALLVSIYKAHPKDRHGANALLRLGIAMRKEGNEADARKFWRKAYVELGETIGGRLSSLLLADIWYNEYCAAQIPQFDKWEAVRDAYSNSIGMDEAAFLGKKIKTKVAERLTRLNSRIFFSRYPCRGAEFYVVKQKDRLSDIARRYGVHYDGIATINGIKRPQYYVRLGEKLKVIKQPAYIVVDKSDRTLTLYMGGKWIKQYRICHGGNRTPPSTYTIITKSTSPSWTDPNTKRVYKSTDPKNILGTRWLGFNNDGPTESLGIHGTTLPHTIPGDTSNGCVRMYNKDVEELYGFALISTQVLIRE